MKNILLKLLGLKLTSEEETLIKKLRDSDITSRRVIGRGTLVMDASDVRQSKKFKSYIERVRSVIGE